MKEQEKHSEIRELLRKLDSIKASDDFEKRLNLKVVEEESRRRQEHTERYRNGVLDFLQQVISGRTYPWLVPATGVVAVLFLSLYLLYTTRTNFDQQANRTDTALSGSSIAGNDKPGEEKSADEQQERLRVPSKMPTDAGTSEVKPLHKEPQIQREPAVTSAPKITVPLVDAPVAEEKAGIEQGKVAEKSVDAAREREDAAVMFRQEQEIGESTEPESIRAETEMPDARAGVTAKADTGKTAMKKKLELLNRKWLEELEQKINKK